MKIYFRDTRIPELSGLSREQVRETRILAQRLLNEERRWMSTLPTTISIGVGILIAFLVFPLYRELLSIQWDYLAFIFAPITGALPSIAFAPFDIHLRRPYLLKARRVLFEEELA